MMILKLILILCSVLYQVSGHPANVTRVIHGQITQIEQVPYQASLLYYGQHFCGGSIVSQKAILTAAHCFATPGDPHPQETIVRLGGNGLSDPRGVSFGVSAYHQHPNFNMIGLRNDVGVLILTSIIPFNDRMKPIRFPSRSPSPGTTALASGWGRTENDLVSRELRSIEVKLITLEECHRYTLAHHTTLCTSMNYFGVCHGDSGGPLMYQGEVIGVSSFVYPECKSNNAHFLSAFADVYQLRSFIDPIVQTY